MKIGIIGAGNIGGTLAGRFTALGHEVSIANSRGPETLREVEAETGATPVPIHEAARGKDVVVVTMPVAGDDQAAKSMVMGLVDELGFDAVDSGPLGESWRQQPGTPVYATDFDADGVRRALEEASPERQAGFRVTPNSPGTYTNPA